MIEARMIVDFESPISMRYAEISTESFQPAIQKGYISRIRYTQCVTPDMINLSEHGMYNWQPSLMGLDNGTREIASKSERAGMCSHFDLLRHSSGKPIYGMDSTVQYKNPPFLVLEHDAYLLPDQVDIFGELVNIIVEHDPSYANIGLFMACYFVNQDTSSVFRSLLTDGNFPINGGPYSVFERLYKTYIANYPNNNGNDIIHPWHGCDTLGIGNGHDDIHAFFNTYDPDPDGNKFKTPVTQVISKSLKVTQDHHTYSESKRLEPWTRHHYFKVID